MKIGVFTVLFAQQSLERALDYIAQSGVQMVEFGTGGYPGNAHCDPDKLLGNASAQKEFLNAVESRGLSISALSCHGNPVHPDKAFAARDHETFRKTVQLAKELGVDTVVTFSGCPGGSPDDKTPNWVTCAWPPDFTDTLKWQWEEVLVPYWKEQSKFLEDNGVKVAFEMHPGFCVYNVDTMLKLRDAVGENLGCNFDPSHLFWNGVDPVAAIRTLGDAIFHVHAKDCKVDKYNVAVNGCNDTKHYGDVLTRSWIFRTVGYGHGYQVWKDMISTLKMIGYDSVLSIEHEDGLMSVNEGFQKAVSFLKEVMVTESAGEMWWA
ncbi:sugar phosphate isomerase/epimerase [bacterium]|nr:sugar phosphate isomerase/epimerase [bacterium]